MDLFVSLKDPEKYILPIVLLNRPVAASYKELRTIKGVLHNTYWAACILLDLLENEFEWHKCLRDSYKWSSERLTGIPATILVHCEPSDPKSLFLNNKKLFKDDIRKRIGGSSVALGLLQSKKNSEDNVLSEVLDALARTGCFAQN